MLGELFTFIKMHTKAVGLKSMVPGFSFISLGIGNNIREAWANFAQKAFEDK